MSSLLKKEFNEIPVSGNWLGFLRISVALFALLHFLSIQPDFNNLFSYDGYVQPDILDATQDKLSPTIFSIYNFIIKFFPGLLYDQLVFIFSISYLVFLTCLATGFLTRFNAIASLLIQLVLIKSIHFFQYGADFFTTILLFYCSIFPVGAIFSIDKRLFKRTEKINHIQYLRLLQIHLCIVYFIGGLDKILGFNWRNGESLWKAVTDHNMTGLIQLDFLKDTPFFLIGGWVTILVEMMYPLFINLRKTRKVWLLLTILLHVSIALFMGLYFFATIMIIFNLSAYGIPYSREKMKDIKTFLPAIRLPIFKRFSVIKSSTV